MSRNYTSLFDTWEAEMLQDADNAITQCDLWNWLRDYTPEDGKGFMFSQHPNLTRIDNAMKYQGHSGASHGWTMRQMEYIAKHGWTLFEFTIREQRRKDEDLKKRRDKEVLNVLFHASMTADDLIRDAFAKDNGTVNPLTIAEAGRSVLPDGEQQYDAIKKFTEGKMSYAEMRSLCG